MHAKPPPSPGSDTTTPMSVLDAAVSRRHFLKVGLTSAVIIAIGAQAKLASDLLGGTAVAAPSLYDLAITDAMVEMVDLTVVYHRVFADASGAHLPGPILHALEGDEVQLRITNALDEPHAFAVDGTAIRTGPIAPGARASSRSPPPPPGPTSISIRSDAPLNRLIGLHGRHGGPAACGTVPYTAPAAGARPPVRRPRHVRATFPVSRGSRSAPASGTCTRSTPGGMPRRRPGRASTPCALRPTSSRRYFPLNGQSGFFASHDPAQHAGRPRRPAAPDPHRQHRHGRALACTSMATTSS